MTKLRQVLTCASKGEEYPAWQGCDLDGTLAFYDHGKFKPGQIGDPIPSMVERIKRTIAAGTEVRIFTARVSYGPEAVTAVQDWLEQVAGLPRLAVTNVKDPGMFQLWDDRARQVIENTGELVVAKP